MFGPESFTEHVGDPYASPKPVRCPEDSVLTSVPVKVNLKRYTAAAGAVCRSLGVGSEGIFFGAEKYAGWFGDISEGNYDARTDCPASAAVVGFVASLSGKNVVALGVLCRQLRADGTLGDADIPGKVIGVQTNTQKSYRCPGGQVATGISGSAATDPREYGLTAFALRCQAFGFPSEEPEDVNLAWPTALTVGANSTTAGAITATGQDRWYRFPVQPGGRVSVELSDLPADYDMTLFKDIDQAFTDLTTPEDLAKLSAEFAGDAYAPSVFSPSVFSPSVFSPSVFSPSVFSPSVFSPSVFSPSVFSPSVFSPSVFSPSVFSPSVFSPSVFSPSVSLPSVFSPSVFSPSVFSPSVFSDAFASAQTRSVIGFSAKDGTATESISTATWNNTGYFYVRVQGRNGSFSADDEYTLTVTTTGGICSTGLQTYENTPTLVGTEGSAETVILTDPDRLPGTAAQKATLATAVTAFAAQVDGAVVDLGQSQKVQALQEQADDPDYITCPYAKNLVAEATRDIVNSYRDGDETLKYVVVIGDDTVVPFFRYPDNAGLGPESNYAPPVADNTTSEASLRGNYVLGQDAYGAETDVSIKGTEMPVPDLAVGRLVESPVDITATLQRFAARAGVPLSPTSTLTTGYDFLTDAADSVAGTFRDAIPTGRHDTLITDADVPPTTTTPAGGTPSRRASWTATDLRRSLFGSRHDMVFLAGHFSANNTLAADYDTTVNSTEVTAAPANTFADTLIFSAGCHSGYTVVDADGVPGVTVGLDWTEAFAKQGATLIAGTGYQYGDTDFLEYSEKLYADFARQLRVGSAPVPIGQALLQAKQNYLNGSPTLQGIDQKSVLEATLYGLPMLGVSVPGKLSEPADPSTASPDPVAQDTPGGELDLEADTVALNNLSLTPVNRTLTNLEGGSVTAQYLTGPDGVSVNPAEPAVPLISDNVTAPDGKLLRGIALRSGRYTDTNGITPLTGAPATETHSVHTPFVTPAFFPGRIATANYLDALGGSASGGTTRLNVTPVQHRSDGPGSLTTTQRAYSSVGLQLFYSGNISTYGENTPALAAPPSITDVRTTVSGSTVEFSARVVGDPSAGIQTVFVTYTGESGSPFHSAWESVDLEQVEGDSTLWTGSLTLPAGQQAAAVRYLVQAVNGVGLVGIDDNQGSYFVPGVIPGEEAGDLQPTALTLSTPVPTEGEYGANVTVRATLRNDAGAALAQRAVTFAIGGTSRTAFTDSTGVAAAAVPLSVLPGSYPLTASYDGDATTAPASTAGTDFTVRKQPTTLTLSLSGPVANATLKGAGGLPLREKTVYFAYLNAAGTVLAGRTAITDRVGTADLDTADRPTGATQLRAYFGSATTPVPGGVVDLSDDSYGAGGPVTVPLPPVAPPVVAENDSYTTAEGRTLTVAAPGVLRNDTSGSIAILANGPTVGQLTLQANGSFSYVPPVDFAGTVTFTYTAKVGDQSSAPATVTITVTEAVPSSPCTIRGTSGNDTLTGTSRSDVICGFGGNDTLVGGDGNDLLFGGSGNDSISGGGGADIAGGGWGNDTINGGAGLDILRGGSGDDTLNGDAGNDLLEGTGGADTLNGGADADLLTGGTGVDKLSGADGNDHLDVKDGAPNDLADGGAGRDTVSRDSGDTVIGVP